jgi:Tfp pilus assembly PilM family ATPase
VKKRNAANTEGPFVDVGHSSLKILWGGKGLRLPVERGSDGKLTESSKKQIVERLQAFLPSRRRSNSKVDCALPARGVSLRRFSLPPVSSEELQRLLWLQMEREFPLPPDDLCWGYQLFDGERGRDRENAEAVQPVVVLALRREIVDDYASLFSVLGLEPVFRL